MKAMSEFKPLGIFALILAAAAIIAGIFTSGSVFTWLSLAFAVFIYFFVPGYAILLLIDIDPIERIIFAFLTGAIAVPITLYFFNLFGIRLTSITVIIAIAIVTAIPLFVLIKKKK